MSQNLLSLPPLARPTSASAYNTSRLMYMVQSIRYQQLEVVPLLTEIAQQKRNSDLAGLLAQWRIRLESFPETTRQGG